MTFADRLLRLMQSFTILDWNKHLVQFRPNIPQQMVWSRLEDHINSGRRVWPIVLKARREGVSTEIQLLLFAYGFYCGNGETLTLAHEGESSRAIFEIQRRVWTNLPISRTAEPPQREIRIASPTGQVVHRVSTAGAEAKGRGTSPIALHLSEVAFWPFPETMTAVLNSMPPPHIQNIVAIESTANGKSGRGALFYESWQMAEQGMSSLIPIFLSCLDLPDYRIKGAQSVDDLDEDELELRDKYNADPEQLAWYRFVLYDQCNGDPMLRRQEYPVSAEQAFISSGLPAFDPTALSRQKVNTRKPDRRCTILADGKLLDRQDGELAIWRHPDGSWPGAFHRYICGSDSAPGGVFEDSGKRGDTRSWTADAFIDADTGAQVGEWYGPQVGRLHANTLHTMVTNVFPNAMLAIELNSEGGRILQASLRQDYHYSNFHPWRGKRDKVRPTAPVLYGWETNSYTRPMILDNAQYLLARDSVTIRSQRLLSQLADLTKSDTGRYEAEVGRDDLAIAWMIGLESWQENFCGKKFGIRTVFNDDSKLETKLRSIGIKFIHDVDGSLQSHIDKVMRGSPQPKYVGRRY